MLDRAAIEPACNHRPLSRCGPVVAPPLPVRSADVDIVAEPKGPV